MTIHERLSAATGHYLAQEHGLLIDGERRPATTGETFTASDPATGEIIARLAHARDADVDLAVRAADIAFRSPAWRDAKPDQRSRWLLRLADLIERDAQDLAELETINNGAPIWLSLKFIEKCAAALRYHAGWVTKANGEVIPVSADGDWHAYTLREPVGVVGLIVPWNAPLMTAISKIAPALAAGCTVVLKPAELTPLTALRLGELALEAGLPKGVFNVVTGFGDAGAALVTHPLVAKISFTGSTRTGQAIMRSAADSMKRVSFELGGKSPFIIFPDADLPSAIRGAANAIFINTGQVCVAGSRLFVHRRIHDEVVQGLMVIAQNMQIGHGLDQGTIIGPLISATQRARVLDFVEQGIAAGAEMVLGGELAAESGHWIKPTIFVGVDPKMTIAREEIFGPVLSVQAFDDEESLEGIATRANDSDYGLAASVWTSNLHTAHRMARLLKSGIVGINAHGVVDIALPFGGVKLSGLGRENGHEGLLAFTETKSVAAALA